MNLMRLISLLTSLLVLPLAFLLFAQWPLREVVGEFSRQANDAAQIVFALYMAVAVTAASLSGTHLAAQAGSTHPPARWRRWALLACVGPWALFMLWASAPGIWASVAQWEKFGETLTPGYFLIKLALGALVLLVLVHAVLHALLAPESEA